MNVRLSAGSACGLLLAWGTVFAQAPAGAPTGSTGACKDGSFTSNATKRGACAGHKGVKEWFQSDAASAKESIPPTAPNAPDAPSEPRGAATAVTPKPAAASVSTKTAVAGGGAGKVWVNSSSKVYHCAGTKYYGTTKQGSYMTEAEAKAAGNHADHGKACT